MAGATVLPSTVAKFVKRSMSLIAPSMLVSSAAFGWTPR